MSHMPEIRIVREEYFTKKENLIRQCIFFQVLHDQYQIQYFVVDSGVVTCLWIGGVTEDGIGSPSFAETNFTRSQELDLKVVVVEIPKTIDNDIPYYVDTPFYKKNSANKMEFGESSRDNRKRRKCLLDERKRNIPSTSSATPATKHSHAAMKNIDNRSVRNIAWCKDQLAKLTLDALRHLQCQLHYYEQNPSINKDIEGEETKDSVDTFIPTTNNGRFYIPIIEDIFRIREVLIYGEKRLENNIEIGDNSNDSPVQRNDNISHTSKRKRE
ncbi:hypothetical protein HS088_TW04G00047 [Tripterygium wilfordii]|uniref:Uncharacterized protein n=1 Tax=Tripterygium wilfordii TaxID=458696 RepID=A0A7J7DP19_TRIWF|nr:hypothetical protein HS088_TW04G00047 [Tripterygium wilfordii]